jgi:hypothetical protein
LPIQHMTGDERRQFFRSIKLIPYHNETTFRPLKSKNRTFDRDSRRSQNEKWPESLPAIP